MGFFNRPALAVYGPYRGTHRLPLQSPKARTLLSQPGHRVAVDYPARATQRFSFELRITQSGPDSLLNQRAFKFRHCPDYLKHEPAGRRREVQIVTQAHKGHTVRIEIGKCVDELLKRAPESVHLPAKHYVKAPQVNI